jgi:fluoride exporter
MSSIFFVGVGSMIGGVLRYELNRWVNGQFEQPWFPYGTLSVNALGCLVIGFLAGASESWLLLSAEMRLLLFTGVLGGFTTFSAFGLETFALAREAHYGAAAANVALQLVLGLLAVWLGHAAGSNVARPGA